MKTMKKIIVFSLVGIIFSMMLSSQVLAIGQITEPIVITNAMRGQEVVSSMKVLNSEKEQNVIKLVAEGQIEGWAKFYAKDDKAFENPITEITVPAGKYMDVGVLFTIPEDAANGDYEGELSVMYDPTQQSSNEDDETSSVVSQKISRSVTISVGGEEQISLEASVIPEKFDYAAGDPVKVRIIYDNRSNISLRPSVQFKLKQDDQTVYNVIYPYPDNEPAVRSMSLYEISAVTIPTVGLGEGEFLAEVTFLRGETQLLTKYFSFTIGEAGAAGVVKGVSWLNPSNNTGKVVLGVIFLVIVIAVIGAVVRKKKQ